MNGTMKQPSSHPFYVTAPRPPLTTSRSLLQFHMLPSYHKQFPLSYTIPSSYSPSFVHYQQQNPYSASMHPSLSSSNRRYHCPNRLTRHPNRRSSVRSLNNSETFRHYSTDHQPIDNYQHQPSKTKSVSNIAPISLSNSNQLSKAHSWHSTMTHRLSNLSVVYAKEIQLTPKARRRNSLPKRKKSYPPRYLSSSPKRKSSFNKHRQRSKQVPERGIIRISTLDEIPMINNSSSHQRKTSIDRDRLSTKGSISNSSQLRILMKERPIKNNSIRNRKTKNNGKIKRMSRSLTEIKLSHCLIFGRNAYGSRNSVNIIVII